MVSSLSFAIRYVEESDIKRIKINGKAEQKILIKFFIKVSYKQGMSML